jgi:hypothetical protein
VQLWGAPIAEEIGDALPDCAKCRKPEFAELRVTWGCDRPAEDPVFSITCSKCDPDDPDPDCAKCDGTGAIKHYRCMTKTIAEGDSAACWGFIRSFQMMEGNGILPDSGGWYDQTSMFADACSILRAERNQWQRIIAAHREAMQQIEESKRRNREAVSLGKGR